MVILPGTLQEGKDLNLMAEEELKEEIEELRQILSVKDNKNITSMDKEQLRKELQELRFEKGDLKNKNKSLVRDKDRTPSAILFAEIESFEDFFWIFSQVFGIQYYWKVPKPILNINLILFMGVLGSLIFVSIEFIKIPRERIAGHSEVNYTMYFVRPFLGMIIALAMYVMINSGLSAFPGTATDELSPFLLSFLGIISGMLAEQAYQRLADTGSKAIGVTTDKSDKILGDGRKDTKKETLECFYSVGVPTTAYSHYGISSFEAGSKPMKQSIANSQTTDRGDRK